MTEKALTPDARLLFNTLWRAPWFQPLLALALIVAIPLGIALVGLSGRPGGETLRSEAYPALPLPPVEPMLFRQVPPETARQINAATPFATVANPPARAFRFNGGAADLARATDCLAAAVYYEAGDDAVGERAVAQVVLNRVRHPAFPHTVCGVIFQGQERATGCQFTFSCDGALGRTPSPAAWDRARDIARAALSGQVYAPVGTATHYHTDWVVPYWSGSLDKLKAVDTHLFFRWKGWWGTRPAFRFDRMGTEPAIPALGRLSAVHAVSTLPGAPLLSQSADAIAAAPALALDANTIGKQFGAARFVAMQADGKGFIVALSSGSPDAWQDAAMQLCAGRPQCRVMGWTRGAPIAFPLDAALLGTMSYSYIQDTSAGLQRSLWNCRAIPRADQRQCMKDREVRAADTRISPSRARAIFRIRGGESVAEEAKTPPPAPARIKPTSQASTVVEPVS